MRAASIMSRGSLAPQESIAFRRTPAVPGLEVLDARDSPRQWRDVGGGFGVTFLRTWHGTAVYRGRAHAVEPGIAFCNEPAEALIATPRAGTAGSFYLLVVAPPPPPGWVSPYQTQKLRPPRRGGPVAPSPPPPRQKSPVLIRFF